MNRDDVLRMALEAGFAYRPEDEHVFAAVVAGLERFAALVAAHEREECAKVCDSKATPTITALRAALAEPAEYAVECNGKKSAVLTAMMNGRTKREAALAEADEPPRREPLTEEKIKAVRRELAAQALLISTAECKCVVRVVERAHGIGDSDE